MIALVWTRFVVLYNCRPVWVWVYFSLMLVAVHVRTLANW